MRKALIIAGSVVVVFLLLALVLPFVVPLDALKPRIVVALEERSGRKVLLESLSVSLLPPGVKVSNLSVSGDAKHPSESFLTVPSASLRVSLLPLLIGRVELESFVLSKPSIVVYKYADGTSSVSDIAMRLGAKGGAAKKADGGGRVGAGISIGSVRIDGAALSLRLEDVGGRERRWEVSPFSFNLDGLGRDKHDISMSAGIDGALRGDVSYAGEFVHRADATDDSFGFDLTGKGALFGQQMTLSGSVSSASGPVEADLSLSMPSVEMDRLLGAVPSLPPALAGMQMGGTGSLSVKAVGGLTGLGIEAEADLTKASWTTPHELKKFSGSPMKVVVQGRWFPEQIVLSNVELLAPPLSVAGTASFSPGTGAREWSASARISDLVEYSKTRGIDQNRFHLAGKIVASGTGRRAAVAAKESWKVRADLVEVGAIVPGRKIEFRGLSGQVESTESSIAFEPFTGLVNGQRFRLRGSVGLAGEPVGQVDFRMAYLDLDELFPPDAYANGKKDDGNGVGKAAKAEASDEKKEVAPTVETEPSKIAARVTIFVEAGKARGVEFHELSGLMRYAREELQVDSARVKLFGGEAALAGRISFRAAKPDFDVKIDAKGLSAGALLASKTSLGPLVDGSATVSLSLAGESTDFAAFSKSAKGSGSAKLSNGSFKGTGLLADAAGAGGVLPLIPANMKVADTSFRELSSDFRVDGGRIKTDALRLFGDSVEFAGPVSVGFDRSFEGKGVVRLPKELSAKVKGAAGKFLTDSQGRVSIPVTMGGAVTKPSVSLDSAALAKGMVGNLIGGLLDRIGGKKK